MKFLNLTIVLMLLFPKPIIAMEQEIKSMIEEASLAGTHLAFIEAAVSEF